MSRRGGRHNLSQGECWKKRCMGRWKRRVETPRITWFSLNTESTLQPRQISSQTVSKPRTPSTDIDNTSQHDLRLEEEFQSRLFFESAFFVSGCSAWIFVFWGVEEDRIRFDYMRQIQMKLGMVQTGVAVSLESKIVNTLKYNDLWKMEGLKTATQCYWALNHAEKSHTSRNWDWFWDCQ